MRISFLLVRLFAYRDVHLKATSVNFGLLTLASKLWNEISVTLLQTMVAKVAQKWLKS